jgi:hypothetical protein
LTAERHLKRVIPHKQKEIGLITGVEIDEKEQKTETRGPNNGCKKLIRDDKKVSEGSSTGWKSKLRPRAQRIRT